MMMLTLTDDGENRLKTKMTVNMKMVKMVKMAKMMKMTTTTTTTTTTT